jgi:hypothetical protein
MSQQTVVSQTRVAPRGWIVVGLAAACWAVVIGAAVAFQQVLSNLAG